MATQIIDHVAQAIARLNEQHKSQTKLLAFLSAVAEPSQPLEDALWQLFTERSVDVAVGAQLDALGNIVGQDRGGLDDDTYRAYIRARIATNRSRGLVEDLIIVALLIVDDPNAHVDVDRQGTASVRVRVDTTNVDATLEDTLIRFLRQVVAAGVRLILETEVDAEAEMFTTAIFSAANGAILLGATTITVDDTTDFPDSGSLDLDVGLAAEETVTYTGKTSTDFLGVSATTFAHPDRTAVQLNGSPGKGFGDDAVPTTGGKFASAVE